MQTKKLYDTQPYETSFQGRVISAVPGKAEGTLDVVLDQTLFFPEEGGQTPDRGELAGYPVVNVQIDSDGVITHTLQVTGRPSAAGSTDGPADASAAAACSPRVTESDNIPSPQAAAQVSMPGSLMPGLEVPGTIDWAHRYSNMQNHSGEHVLSGLLHSIYGYENVGFHLSDHTVTLDTSGPLSDEQIRDLEKRANEVVYRNVPITCEYPAPEVLAKLDYRSKKAIDGPVRIVTIQGVDVCACCAPHVARTGEIGIIKILSAVRSKASTRLFILCGSRALADYDDRLDQLETISHQTNYPQDQAAEGVQKLLDEITSLKDSLRTAQSRYVDMKLSVIRTRRQAADTSGTAASGNGTRSDDVSASGAGDTASSGQAAQSIWEFEDSSMDTLTQRRFMNALCDMGFRFAGVFTGSDEEGWKYLIGSRSDNANTPNQVLRSRFQARGGGKPEMVQGSVHATRAQLEEALQSIQYASMTGRTGSDD